MKTIVVVLGGQGGDLVNIDGVTIPIDDGEPRAHALRQALATYIQSARRAEPGITYRLVPVPPDESLSRRVRDWWRAHPKGLPEWKRHGRLPQSVLTAYERRNDTPRARRVENFDALGRAMALAEARASVALDGETQCVDSCAEEAEAP